MRYFGKMKWCINHCSLWMRLHIDQNQLPTKQLPHTPNIPFHTTYKQDNTSLVHILTFCVIRNWTSCVTFLKFGPQWVGLTLLAFLQLLCSLENIQHFNFPTTYSLKEKHIFHFRTTQNEIIWPWKGQFNNFNL
jgi:hypothetical protein